MGTCGAGSAGGVTLEVVWGCGCVRSQHGSALLDGCYGPSAQSIAPQQNYDLTLCSSLLTMFDFQQQARRSSCHRTSLGAVVTVTPLGVGQPPPRPEPRPLPFELATAGPAQITRCPSRRYAGSPLSCLGKEPLLKDRGVKLPFYGTTSSDRQEPEEPHCQQGTHHRRRSRANADPQAQASAPVPASRRDLRTIALQHDQALRSNYCPYQALLQERGANPQCPAICCILD